MNKMRELDKNPLKKGQFDNERLAKNWMELFAWGEEQERKLAKAFNKKK